MNHEHRPDQRPDRLDENHKGHVDPPFRNPVPERDQQAEPPPKDTGSGQ